MKQNDHGFTLVEVVVVMVLVSIIAAAVFTRSIRTAELNLASRAEKLPSQIRYAQSLAMKTGEVWGIFCTGSDYWLFNGYQAADVITGVALPGEENDKISLAGSGININLFSVFFDEYGKPYIQLDYDNPGNTQAVSAGSELTITITSDEDGSLNRKFSITPETGLIVSLP